jgi:hypothetical protein
LRRGQADELGSRRERAAEVARIELVALSSWALARRGHRRVEEDWHAAPDQEHDHGPQTQGSKTDCQRGPDAEDGR